MDVRRAAPTSSNFILLKRFLSTKSSDRKRAPPGQVLFNALRSWGMSKKWCKHAVLSQSVTTATSESSEEMSPWFTAPRGRSEFLSVWLHARWSSPALCHVPQLSAGLGVLWRNITSQIFQHTWKVWLKEIWSLKQISTFQKRTELSRTETPIQTNTTAQSDHVGFLYSLTCYIDILHIYHVVGVASIFCDRSDCFVLKTSQLFRKVQVLFFFFQIFSTYFLSPMNHVMHQHPPCSHVPMSTIIQLIYQDIVCIETRCTYINDFTSTLHRHKHLSCFFPWMQFDSET